MANASKIVFLLATAAVLRAAPSAYAGSKACAACHTSQFARQSLSAHATALFRAAQHPLASSFPTGTKLTRKPAYLFQFSKSNDELRVRISDRADVMDLPIEWAFGAGRQAVTFVTRVNSEWYVEHYGSYYSALHDYRATPGQDALRPTSLPEAAGVIYKTADPDNGIAGCFECHSTGPVGFDLSGNVQLTETGVGCESCHGPGAAHAVDPGRNPVNNPANLSAAQVNDFCGRCHRPPAAKGVKIDWNYAWNVRHQPVYLNESQCFRKSRGALSCFTCHAPHEAARKTPVAFYNGKCVGCHSAGHRPPKPVCEAAKPANCIDCHMPLVSPQPPLRFTNHWIGVYATGAKLKPVR